MVAAVLLAFNLLKEQEPTLVVVAPELEEVEFIPTTAVMTIATSVVDLEEY